MAALGGVPGGIAAAAFLTAQLGALAAGARTSAELLTPDSAVVFLRLTHPFVIAAEVTAAVFVLAVSLLVLARVVARRWAGWVGLPIAALLLVTPLAWLGLLLLLPLWVALLGVGLFVDGRRSPSDGVTPGA